MTALLGGLARRPAFREIKSKLFDSGLSAANRTKPSGEGRGSSAAGALGLARPFPGECIDFGSEPLGLVGVGIEVVADPLCELGVALVLWIGNSFEHFGVAPWAATVLERTAAADFNQARIERTRRGVGEAFDFDRVLPAIAEVVEIDELLCADIFEDVVEPGFAGVEEVTGRISIGVWRTPADITGAQLVEMAVGPAHGGLNGQMQPVEPDVEWHINAAQDCGLDVVEGDLETAMVSALMPPLYDAPSRWPSSTARVRPACGWDAR
jgi:hypothetical protein